MTQLGLLLSQKHLEVAVGLHPSQMSRDQLVTEILRLEFPGLMAPTGNAPEPDKPEPAGHLRTPTFYALVMDIGPEPSPDPRESFLGDWLSDEPELRDEQLDVIEHLWATYAEEHASRYRFHTERALIALGWPGPAAAYAVRMMHERTYTRG